MPRTKRPAKRLDKAADGDDGLKKLNKLVSDQKKDIDSVAYVQMKNVDIAFKIFLGSIDTSCLQKTIGELRAEQLLNEVNNSQKRTRGRTASYDDGYLTENSSQGSGDRGNKKILGPPSTISRTTSRRSRSADASRGNVSAKQKRSCSAYRTPMYNKNPSASVYRTPMYNKNPSSYPAITPKVAPHTPLTVLRQPRQGEMVVSMSGSPVMVPSCYTMQQDDKANCNIMLRDGTMLTLQPKQLRQSQAFIPFSLMDSNVLHQLKTLKDNLDKVVQLGRKAIDD